MDIAELSMILEQLGPTIISDEDFENATKIVKESKNLEQDQQLLLYGLYKQYTVGDVNISEPSKLNFVGHAKWVAWNNLKGFPSQNAKIAYSYIANNLLGKQPTPEEAAEGAPMDGFGVTVSTLHKEYAEELNWSADEAIFKAVTENDMEALRKCISSGDRVNVINEEGMTPLHFAADRGYTSLVELLLEHGANINATDTTQQTPLMYAVNCEYKDTVEVLIARGADVSLKNDEGLSVIEFDDVPTEITEILSAAVAGTPIIVAKS